MILKILYENYQLDISYLIFEEYKNLELSKEEAWFLIGIFKLDKLKIDITKNNIIKHIEPNITKAEQILINLSEKNFFDLELKKDKKNKTFEAFNFDKTFNLLENILREKAHNQVLESNKNNISKTVSALEKVLKKVLSSNDIAVVKSWYFENLAPQDIILSTILSYETDPSASLIKIEKTIKSRQKLFKKEQETINENELKSLLETIK